MGRFASLEDSCNLRTRRFNSTHYAMTPGWSPTRNLATNVSTVSEARFQPQTRVAATCGEEIARLERRPLQARRAIADQDSSRTRL